MWPCATAQRMNEFLRPQVEDVELVDPGRHDQERPRRTSSVVGVYWMSCIMLVLEDHLAGRGGDVLAEPEGVHVGHRDREAALAALEVLQQVGEPLEQVLAAGLDGRLQHLRIGRRRSSTARSRRRTGAYRTRPCCAVLSSRPSTLRTVERIDSAEIR